MTSIVRRILLPLGVALTVATPFALADALGPGAAQPVIAAAVVQTLQTGHYAAARGSHGSTPATGTPNAEDTSSGPYGRWPPTTTAALPSSRPTAADSNLAR